MNAWWLAPLSLGVLVSAALLLPGGSSAQSPRIVMMASTIGPIDAGIVSALEDAFFQRTGIVVRHAGAGTGAALEMAKTGSFDLVMVPPARSRPSSLGATTRERTSGRRRSGKRPG